MSIRSIRHVTGSFKLPSALLSKTTTLFRCRKFTNVHDLLYSHLFLWHGGVRFFLSNRWVIWVLIRRGVGAVLIEVFGEEIRQQSRCSWGSTALRASVFRFIGALTVSMGYAIESKLQLLSKDGFVEIFLNSTQVVMLVIITHPVHLPVRLPIRRYWIIWCA